MILKRRHSLGLLS